MRAIFSVISLVIVMSVVVMLSKKQLGSIASAPIRQQSSAVVNGSATYPTTSGAEISQAPIPQIEQQIKQSLEAAMQQARSVSDEAK